jgi:hypothetical protein
MKETYEESVFKKGCGICITCGNDLKENVLGIPDAMKVLVIEIEAYSRQKTLYTGPELWLCQKCAQKMAKNIAMHAQRFNDIG